MAAGRQDSVGYGGRLEEVQDGDGNSTAGSSIFIMTDLKMSTWEVQTGCQEILTEE